MSDLVENLEEVLCPKCTHPGGLKVFMECVSRSPGEYLPVGPQGKIYVRWVPILSCALAGCNLVLVGQIQGDEAVFPDPHVEAKR